MEDFYTSTETREIIAGLHEEIERLKTKIHNIIITIDDSSRIYLAIQHAAINDEMVMNAWQEFLVTLKMSNEFENFKFK